VPESRSKKGKVFETSKRITVRLPLNLADRLEDAAVKSNLTVTDVIKAIVSLSLENLERPSPLTTKEMRALRVLIRHCRTSIERFPNSAVQGALAVLNELEH